jgi:cytochrome P450
VTFSSAFQFLATGTDIRNAIMGHYVWLHDLTLGNPLLSRLGLQPSSHIFDTCLAPIEYRNGNPAARLDMMERWLHVRRQYQDRMSEAEILGAAVTNIGASADATSTTLQAFFYCLNRHPQHLRKLRWKIDSGDLSDVISYVEEAKLPYLQPA